MRIETGAHVEQTNGVLALALAPGSVGVVDITNGGYINGAGTMVVGQGGFGELNIGAGAELRLTNMTVAFSPSSNGFVSISGEASRVELERLEIGGQGLSPGGGAFVGVSGGAAIQFDVAQTVQLRLCHADAILNIGQGGTVTGSANFETSGHLVMAGGTLSIPSMNFANAAEITGFGTINANIAASTAPNSVIHATGGPLCSAGRSTAKDLRARGRSSAIPPRRSRSAISIRRSSATLCSTPETSRCRRGAARSPRARR